MLDPLVDASASILNAAKDLDPALWNALPTRSTAPAILPAEPSTLTLALIGLGIMGAYAGLQRWRRPKVKVATSREGAKGKDAAPKMPRRGAA